MDRATLARALGLTDGGAEGERVRLKLPGIKPIDAVVDYRTPNFVGLRSIGLHSDDALYRFFGRNAFGGQVDAAHHLFAEGVDAEANPLAWQTLLDEVYA